MLFIKILREAKERLQRIEGGYFLGGDTTEVYSASIFETNLNKNVFLRKK